MGRCLQQTWAVSILLCSIWSCRSCFEISTCGSEWIYTEFKTLQVQFGALFSFMILSECFQKHSLCSWVGMLWFHRSRKFFDLLEEYESNWDVFGSSVSILVIASYIWDVCEAYWLPLASMWDTPALWGQCLRIFCDLWVFDLEVYFVIFISVAYSWHLVMTVSELL